MQSDLGGNAMPKNSAQKNPIAMKMTVIISLLLLLQYGVVTTAASQTRKPSKPRSPRLTWQQYDSLERNEIIRGDTSAAISYLECAGLLNENIKSFLDKIKKKYVHDGNSFYLKEY